MEKVITEFKAKSLFVDNVNCGLFFSWDLFDQGKKLGITIDLHALADVTRSKNEIIKLLYLCFNAYASTAKLFNLGDIQPPTLEQVEGWMLVFPSEATKAIEYATNQLRERVEQNSAQKKSAYPSVS